MKLAFGILFLIIVAPLFLVWLITFFYIFVYVFGGFLIGLPSPGELGSFLGKYASAFYGWLWSLIVRLFHLIFR